MDNEGPRIKEFGLINKTVLCYINSAIQLLWRIDGVRKFFLETSSSYIQALEPFTFSSAFFSANFSNEDFTKSMTASIVVDDTPENKGRIAIKEPIYKNLLEALMTLFKGISKNKNSNIIMNMETINITTNETVLHCIDVFLQTLMPDGGVGVQDDVVSIIQKFLLALEYFMNDRIYQIYKEYTFVSTKIISTTGSNKVKEEVRQVKSYLQNWIVPMPQTINTYKTNLSDLIKESQKEVELEGYSHPPNKSYEKNTPALFEESNTVIITMARAETMVSAIRINVIIPDKKLLISNKTYTLQGCIIHLGVQGITKDGVFQSYGHYVFYTYDNTGAPIKRISDDTNEEFIDEYNNEINTRGCVFLYKDLSKPGAEPGAALKPELKPALKPALKPEPVAKPTPQSIAQPFINHAMSRIAELRNKLLTNEKFLVAIGGNAKNNTQSLGTDLAKTQWHNNMESKYGEEEVSAAHTLFINTLQTEFEKLRTTFKERVSYTWFNDAEISKADKNYYLVWGANADNWIGTTGTPIAGGGMAAAMKSHKEGIYGIITTPYLPQDMIKCPTVLTSIVKYNYIWDMVKSNIAIEINKKTKSEQNKYKYDLYKALVLSKYSSTKDGLKPESEAEGIILKICEFLNISDPQHRQVINELNSTITDPAIKKQIAEDIKKLPVIAKDDGKAKAGEDDGKAAKIRALAIKMKAEEAELLHPHYGVEPAVKADGKAKVKAGEDDEKAEEEDDEKAEEEDDGKADGEDDEKAEAGAEEVAHILINSFKKSPFLTSTSIVETLNTITRQIRESESEDTYVKLIEGKITINFTPQE
jgi:hypothetical protein